MSASCPQTNGYVLMQQTRQECSEPTLGGDDKEAAEPGLCVPSKCQRIFMG